MLDIWQILLIFIEIWKLQKENQLYSICLGTARYLQKENQLYSICLGTARYF